MAAKVPNRSSDAFADPREIAKWAGRYAKNRTIPFLIQWICIVMLGVFIAAVVFLTLRAYRSENVLWILLCAAGIVGMIVAMAWFIVPKWGGDRIYRISQWIYGEEGYAAYLGGSGESIKASSWVYAAGIGLAAYHLLGVLLIAGRYLPFQYTQPFSALYMVPFFIAMTITQRLGFWAFIWPVLYGLHAVLILLGVPIRFTDVNLEILNMIVPVFGYGLVAILVGHLFSRYALHRLKALVRQGLVETAEAESEDQS
ncbi:MAG TPA: hypothetical protein PLO37_03460 [Candidatus Hydrogenedentes bacterium]|nr:hypothetical protein [Candidatus Hydrogenedentota bacterium]HPG65878.1 hypothetical protein [Candidatus Hydrogenedentota bacterium]